MGLEIGTLQARWDVEQPEGAALAFAQELGERAASRSKMAGMARCWAGFSQRRMLRMLDEFAQERELSAEERREVWEWVAALPWARWRETLDPPPTDPAEYGERHVGGIVELYFEW